MSINTASGHIELLEHPGLTNGYTDGTGNLVHIQNRGLINFSMLSSLAPSIFESVENEIFQKKLIN